ncbi:putative beta-lactamase HcpC [Xenia sp. Carnegie-2017]|uniref:putative beta-lactamase HcpC n=1 Tax=Xenia sp. Carnegie-2017 TaxID=2897299 RepID=UPI001F03AC90|nr:putative beta-lactamase HcpC [Xenia sp. Carnegie-2017]
MWRTPFITSLLHKKVGLLRSSTHLKRIGFVDIKHLVLCTDIKKCQESSHVQNVAALPNIVNAQKTIVDLFMKCKDHSRWTSTSKDSLIQCNVDQIVESISVTKSDDNFNLTVCTPKTNQDKESRFRTKSFIAFEQWCYGFMVVSSLLSWQKLFSDEVKKDPWLLWQENLTCCILPANSSLKTSDSLDKVWLSFENAVADCLSISENALAIKLSNFKMHEMAFTFFERASKKGNIAAHFNLGLCYQQGLGTRKDISKAVSSYSIASSNGHLNATFNLALIYIEGKLYPLKKADGLEMMNNAGEGGLVKAQRFLGLYYADKENAEFDMKKSFHWLKIASEKKDMSSLYHLGICYENGLGVSRNMMKAKDCYKLAAENGHPGAQYNLAVFHELGLGGLNRSIDKALAWYHSAAENGNDSEKALLNGNEKQSIKKISHNLLDTPYTNCSILKQGTIIPV